jgi:hypothetical protein
VVSLKDGYLEFILTADPCRLFAGAGKSVGLRRIKWQGEKFLTFTLHRIRCLFVVESRNILWIGML